VDAEILQEFPAQSPEAVNLQPSAVTDDENCEVIKASSERTNGFIAQNAGAKLVQKHFPEVSRERARQSPEATNPARRDHGVARAHEAHRPPTVEPFLDLYWNLDQIVVWAETRDPGGQPSRAECGASLKGRSKDGGPCPARARKVASPATGNARL
jgi:hypothetical protein